MRCVSDAPYGMTGFRRVIVMLAMVLAAQLACAADAEIGAIVMHGKWGSPDRQVKSVADALERAGFVVANPEMAWSRRRLYDKSVEQTDTDVDAEIEKLKARGAKQIFLVGHSLGAAYALHQGTRAAFAGIVAIAPGHRPESPRLADALSGDVSKARELVAAGKPAEPVSFTDFNTGNRRERMNVSAASLVSYFDPAGPMNMGRNVREVKPETPVLWLVPAREEAGLRQGNLALYRQLPGNPKTKLGEPDADHLGAPAASTAMIVEWIGSVTK